MTCCLLIHWPTLRNGEEPVHDIQVICAEWNDKMKKYKEMGYSEKQALNISSEERKLADIVFLKKQNPPGPFTRYNKVSDYLGNDNNEAVKDKQLCIEVRLVKSRCLSLKLSSSLFF